MFQVWHTTLPIRQLEALLQQLQRHRNSLLEGPKQGNVMGMELAENDCT
jgi:hypothetical protein